MTERTETRPLALDRSSGITSPSPYLRFTAEEWGRLRAATPLTLTEVQRDQTYQVTEGSNAEKLTPPAAFAWPAADAHGGHMHHGN